MFLSIQEELESRGVEFTIDPVGEGQFYWFMSDGSCLPVGVTGEELYPTKEQAVLAAAPYFGVEASPSIPVLDADHQDCE